MKRFHRRSISFIMTAVYLLITFSPLVSGSSRLHPFLQLLTRECSGDCRRCGCSAERSAARTCCCGQKRAAEAKLRQQCALTKLQPTDPAVAETKAGGDCCTKYVQQYAAEKTTVAAVFSDHQSDDDSHTVSISTCPCGSGNDPTFSGFERSQHIPFRYLAGIPSQSVTQLTFLQPEQLASRSAEPPDPPPKLVAS